MSGEGSSPSPSANTRAWPKWLWHSAYNREAGGSNPPVRILEALTVILSGVEDLPAWYFAGVPQLAEGPGLEPGGWEFESPRPYSYDSSRLVQVQRNRQIGI